MSVNDSTSPQHQPVLLSEVIERLAPERDKLLVDATLGLGGHSERLLELGARVLGLDRDPESIALTRERLKHYVDDDRLIARQADYRELIAVLEREATGPIAGLVADLGVSSYQLLAPDRGFSLKNDGPLDMRMDQTATTPTAADIVNRSDPAELVRILRSYGEEKQARRIVRAIVEARAETPIETTRSLAAIVTGAKWRPRGGQRTMHPATRTFQALRIAVNDELRALGQFVDDAVAALKRGGRVVVISFHSLEDRQIKHALHDLARGCICPPELVVCRCGRKPQVRLLGRRAVRASEAEQATNPRARSARLRAAEKLTDELHPNLEAAA